METIVNRNTEVGKSAYGTGYLATAHEGGMHESQDEENFYEKMEL